MRLSVLLCFCCAALLPAATPGSVSSQTIDLAFNRLYNHDFDGSRRILAQYTAAHPDDPLGHAVRSSALLYSELNRLNLLGRDFMTSDERIASPKPGKPDPALRNEFMAVTAEALQRGQARLQAAPADRNALLALCLAYSAQRDFAALVEKRFRDSFNHAKEAQGYAVRLLKVDPQAYDAYLTTGFSEYLVGNLPFYAKWFVKMDGVQGDKQQGLRNLEIVAKSGHYLKPFAQMMLATFYLREKRDAESHQLLVELAREFPENPIFRREAVRVP